MEIPRRLMPPLASALTSPRTRHALRALAEAKRLLTLAPHRVLYFHQADDPYAALVAQILPAFVARYDVELIPHLVRPPADDIAPERERLEALARRDAADVAPYFGLEFSPSGAPNAAHLFAAHEILAAAIEGGRFIEAVGPVTAALFGGDATQLAQQRIAHGTAEPAWADDRRTELGHYLGATFYYGGEWYWGVDRLHYLEARLAARGRRKDDGADPLVQPPTFDDDVRVDDASEPLQLEFFPSARSPYSYLALDETFGLADRYPLEIVLRPVLPMVMRGLPVPLIKRRYILLDAAREAQRIGVPFGWICDPVGEPIKRLYALLPWARTEDRERELFVSFCRGAWADGIDGGTDAGLQKIVERAGLDPTSIPEHLSDGSWEAEVERNCTAMFDAGVWGVPSFRLTGGGTPFVTWGRDRLWRVEAEIRERLGRPAQIPRAAPAEGDRSVSSTR